MRWRLSLVYVGLGCILTGCCIINQPPIARFTWNPTSPQVGTLIQFVDQSYDPDGTITQWEWDFGDGGRASGATVTHTYNSAGNYPVRLVVTDNCGVRNSITQIVTVQAGTGGGGTPSCPPLDVRVWLDRTTFQIGEEVVVHMYFNQTVLATLTVQIVATGGVRTVFSNQFFGPGRHDFRAIVGNPEGERIMTLTAVNSCGQVATATFAYRAWGGSPIIIGPG